MSRGPNALHVFIGTKAQYIKTAPVLHALDRREVPYRLIDSGQHAELSAALRTELGVREPDVRLGDERDVTSIPQALAWSATVAARLVSGSKVRRDLFDDRGGICIVHGDTPSTLLATLLARRAGLSVAHLEAGLRSGSVLNPFPEEAIRMVVMRLSALLFAPDSAAVANLARMKVRGRVVPLAGNTSADAVAAAATRPDEQGPVVVTMHRVENLHRGAVVDELVGTVERLAAERPVRFVVHGPTRATLASSGADARLRAAGVELVDLVPHGEFVAMLAAAPFVITDGGSIQEECALLGVPTLLWRRRTERPDGLGANVVLSGLDADTVAAFLADPERHRRPPAPPVEVSPADQIAEELAAALDALG